jgi:hypothetical protein
VLEDGEDETLEERGREQAALHSKPASRKKRTKQTYYMKF